MGRGKMRGEMAPKVERKVRQGVIERDDVRYIVNTYDPVMSYPDGHPLRTWWLSLSYPTRIIMCLYAELHSYTIVAEILHVSPKTVRKIIARVRASAPGYTGNNVDDDNDDEIYIYSDYNRIRRRP